jgi:hypothetical protein
MRLRDIGCGVLYLTYFEGAGMVQHQIDHIMPGRIYIEVGIEAVNFTNTAFIDSHCRPPMVLCLVALQSPTDPKVALVNGQLLPPYCYDDQTPTLALRSST